nr:hypothetical protein OHB51_22880 [Micromonospora sp. NBC_00855]
MTLRLRSGQIPDATNRCQHDGECAAPALRVPRIFDRDDMLAAAATPGMPTAL